ncbi:hypothetical protein NPIL_438691 [Nephila pilipes]|uniref:Uncharacterized protein n=1 Tax=Nephila pilipes TaxID=299642 RepID=A0A8X6PXU1_NEPPI|nr:hypothetical protein NPIL_389091 [Nephila pilipes]GFT94734.1 hypothetical protein NPIL_438691 [Nephila pilipes]
MNEKLKECAATTRKSLEEHLKFLEVIIEGKRIGKESEIFKRIKESPLTSPNGMGTHIGRFGSSLRRREYSHLKKIYLKEFGLNQS